ncbi:hypothetical protein BKA58DRAFT_433133 [Alternaria rosae]|uniref:uncharacterized protein n=1 Tax=Alternaria rosae TaxID=1187941 RepID=UPI001E8E1DAB|nr:uncharacterized protein BKA58DRAFT_433133 [Alternaria rosae]KAH6881340.1 hypothetical protein BKA58DRAFT_433133 [Alternaria rosae]
MRFQVSVAFLILSAALVFTPILATPIDRYDPPQKGVCQQEGNICYVENGWIRPCRSQCSGDGAACYATSRETNCY